ncbi:MAG TPA: GGDEF domain-containing protein, partial [bacterium]
SHLLVLPGEEYQEIARQSPKEKLLWGKPDFVVGIPMLFKGAIKGGVILYDIKSADYELEVKRDYLQGLANQIAIFLENTRLYSLVIRDRLTGLFVHTFIEAQLENLLAQAKRYKFPVTFIMLDVDKFKLINDQFGHPIGNELLKAVGHAILGVSRQADMEGRPSTSETPQGVARESDLGGRFGGDEFEVILPHTDKEGALIYAERLRKRIEAVKIEVSPGVEARVTISIGLATFPQDAPDVAKLQGAADTALYSAKALGRNNVVAYQTPPESK